MSRRRLGSRIIARRFPRQDRGGVRGAAAALAEVLGLGRSSSGLESSSPLKKSAARTPQALDRREPKVAAIRSAQQLDTTSPNSCATISIVGSARRLTPRSGKTPLSLPPGGPHRSRRRGSSRPTSTACMSLTSRRFRRAPFVAGGPRHSGQLYLDVFGGRLVAEAWSAWAIGRDRPSCARPCGYRAMTALQVRTAHRRTSAVPGVADVLLRVPDGCRRLPYVRLQFMLHCPITARPHEQVAAFKAIHSGSRLEQIPRPCIPIAIPCRTSSLPDHSNRSLLACWRRLTDNGNRDRGD